MTEPGSETLDLTLVLACYNEAPHLEASVLEILATLERTRWSAELVLVDDCSTDDTRRVIEHVLRKHGERLPMRVLLHPVNTGRGRTVSDGMRAGRGRVVGYLDVDLEVHCRYVPAMVQAVEEGADVALAERVYRLQMSPSFIVRHLLSRGYRRLSAWLLDMPDLDTEAGCKFFERARALELVEACQDPGWFWDTEVMALARRRGLTVRAIPCLFERRADKRSTLRVLPAVIDYTRKLFAFRRRLRAG